jgi:hypothetical protein
MWERGVMTPTLIQVMAVVSPVRWRADGPVTGKVLRRAARILMVIRFVISMIIAHRCPISIKLILTVTA